jgi:hypothetical protein
MARKKKRKQAAATVTGGRIHIRTSTAQQAASFHAYATRRGLNLSALVVGLLMKCLDDERNLQPDAEQV